MPIILDKPESVRPRYVILGYGASGTGKTTLYTSLPKEQFGKIVYLALDSGSEALLSVRREFRDNLIVVMPDYSGKTDIYTEVTTMFRTNWKEKYPEVGTIVVDGFSGWSDLLLRLVANAGVIQSENKGDKHLFFGTKQDGTYVAQPIIGDYGFAQNMMMQAVNLLLRCQNQLNIIVLCTETWWKPEGGSLDTLVGGPETIGGKSISRLAKEFDHVFRITYGTQNVNENGKVVQKSIRKVFTEQRGCWLAKMRHPAPKNPMPEFDLTEDTTAFWKKLLEVAA